MPKKATIRAFFDQSTNTVSYLVGDPQTRRGAIIDPVLDYDHASGKASPSPPTRSSPRQRREGFEIDWILETHAHADHLSGAPYLKLKTDAKVGIGEHIRDVQKIFRPVFNAIDLKDDGSEFDRLFADGEKFKIGPARCRGSLWSWTYAGRRSLSSIEDAVFVGDTLFMPDYGTARADFPGGDARMLYRSIKRLLALPP